MRRLVVVNGWEYLASIGRQYVKIERLPMSNRDSRATVAVPCHEIAGWSADSWDRGQWKRTAALTPGRLAYWLRQNGWRFNPMTKNEKVLKLRQPEFDEILDFKGYWNCDSACGIKIYAIGAGPGAAYPTRYVVVMTQLEDNPGTSVTNAVEIIAASVLTQFLPTADPEKIIWIEHWPPHGGPGLNFPESYDQVFLRYDGSRFHLDESVTGHGWKRLQEANLGEIGILA